MRLFFLFAITALIISCGKNDVSTPLNPFIESKANNNAEDVNTPPLNTEPLNKPSPPNHYSNNWFLQWGWPGEYPNGFSVIEKNITLSARSQANPNLKETLKCPVDYLGMYHPWNKERASQLSFFTATETYEITISETTEVEIIQDGKPKFKTLFTGDIITFLSYLSEGWAIVNIDGVITEISISDIKDWHTTQKDTHLWLGLPCQGQTAWVRFQDIALDNGLADYGHSLSSWGYAADINPSDAISIKQEITQKQIK